MGAKFNDTVPIPISGKGNYGILLEINANMLTEKILIGMFLLVICPHGYSQEVFAPIRDVMKTGNAKEVAKIFAPSVDMNLDGISNTYGKTQAEFVLREFFKKHPISDFSIVHTGSSKGGRQYAIARYLSKNESYNVIIRVREEEGNYLIHEMNFVKE